MYVCKYLAGFETTPNHSRDHFVVHTLHFSPKNVTHDFAKNIKYVWKRLFAMQLFDSRRSIMCSTNRQSIMCSTSRRSNCSTLVDRIVRLSSIDHVFDKLSIDHVLDIASIELFDIASIELFDSRRSIMCSTNCQSIMCSTLRRSNCSTSCRSNCSTSCRSIMRSTRAFAVDRSNGLLLCVFTSAKFVYSIKRGLCLSCRPEQLQLSTKFCADRRNFETSFINRFFPRWSARPVPTFCYR
jgi:hypothetical protein